MSLRDQRDPLGLVHPESSSCFPTLRENSVSDPLTSLDKVTPPAHSRSGIGTLIGLHPEFTFFAPEWSLPNFFTSWHIHKNSTGYDAEQNKQEGIRKFLYMA